MDIHKQSNKDLERKEDDVDLLSYDDFVKYLKKTYEPTNSYSYQIKTYPSISNPSLMLIHIPLELYRLDGVVTQTRVPVLSINYQTKSQGFHSYDKEQATCITLSSELFDNYPELEDMLGEKYDVDTSKRKATPRGPVVVDSKTGPLLNSQCVDIIDLVLSVLKKPLVSKKTNESVWMDIHKRSTGDTERREESIDLMDINDFITYLQSRYKCNIPRKRYKVENWFLGGEDTLMQVDMPIEDISEPGIKMTYTLRLTYDYGKMECIDIASSFQTFFEEYPEFKKYVSDNYQLIKKSKEDFRTFGSDNLIVSKNGKELKFHDYVELVDKALSCVKKPYLKLNESVWMDIHKRSSGDAKRKEESIDLMDFDDFSDYLLDRYKCRNSRNNFGIGTWFLGGPDDWRQIEVPIEIPVKSDKEMASNLRLTYDYNHKECIDFTFPYGTFFAKYPEFRKYVLDNYQVIRKPNDDMRTGTGELILPKPGKKLMFHDYVELIDKALSCSKKPYLKLNESVWMDIHKQSTGDIDRKEEDVNILNPNDFWKCLREIYFDGNMGYDGIGHFDYGINRSFSKNLFEITIPFGAVEGVYNRKTYKKIQRLYLKINDETYKYESIEISDDVEGLEEILSENGYVFEKRLPPKSSIVYPKNGEITNKTIINLIDLLLKTTEFPMLKRNEKV